MSNIISDLLKERGIEIEAEHIKFRLSPDPGGTEPIDRYRKEHPHDPIKMIGEGTLALALPVGVLTYFL